MGIWEIYCFITGVAAGSSPRSLLGVSDYIDDETQDELQELATGLADKLVNTETPSLPPREALETLLLEALTLLHTELPSDVDGEYSMLPESCGEICGEVAVFGTVNGEEEPKLCICKQYNAYGGFDYVLCDDGEWVRTSVQVDTFLDRRCWCYLQSWLRLPLAPQTSWGHELWEVVKHDLMDSGYENIHQNLDYGIICLTWGSQGQFTFNGDVASVSDLLECMCLDDVPHLNEAICQGLRGRDLGPAVFADFQGWVFEALDIWPCRPEGDLIEPTFALFHEPFHQQESAFLTLPIELMLDILSRLSLEDALDVSCACKQLRNQLLQDNALSMLARDMIKDGTLRWVQPCSLVENEVDKANMALVTWFEGKHCANPLQSPSFPILPFLHTCFLKSGSMKNRHRIWGVIKQLERRWIAYQKGEDCNFHASGSEEG